MQMFHFNKPHAKWIDDNNWAYAEIFTLVDLEIGITESEWGTIGGVLSLLSLPVANNWKIYIKTRSIFFIRDEWPGAIVHTIASHSMFIEIIVRNSSDNVASMHTQDDDGNEVDDDGRYCIIMQFESKAYPRFLLIFSNWIAKKKT